MLLAAGMILFACTHQSLTPGNVISLLQTTAFRALWDLHFLHIHLLGEVLAVPEASPKPFPVYCSREALPVGAGVLEEEASHVLMLSVGFECILHLGFSLWRPAQVTGSKCWQLVSSGMFVLFPGAVLGAVQAQRELWFHGSVFPVVRLILTWFDLRCLCCV